MCLMVYGSTMKIKDLTASSFSNIYPTTENKGIHYRLEHWMCDLDIDIDTTCTAKLFINLAVNGRFSYIFRRKKKIFVNFFFKFKIWDEDILFWPKTEN
jgi:hypothetical protein